MGLTWNGDKIEADLRRRLARGLLRAAVFFQTQHKLRLNVSNPRPYRTPSKPGEYPRKRTGSGQQALVFQPVDIAEVARDLRVRVGFLRNEPHLVYLELEQHRLGLLQTFKDLKPQLAALAGAA